MQEPTIATSLKVDDEKVCKNRQLLLVFGFEQMESEIGRLAADFN